MSIRRGFMYWEVQVWSLLLSVSRFVVFAWLGALPPYLVSPSFFIASRPPPSLSSSFVPSLLPVHSPFAESLRTSSLTLNIESHRTRLIRAHAHTIPGL